MVVMDIVAIGLDNEFDDHLICVECATKEEIAEATSDNVFDRGWVDRKNEIQGEEGCTFVFCDRCKEQI
jgi:hypothetical protein